MKLNINFNNKETEDFFKENLLSLCKNSIDISIDIEEENNSNFYTANALNMMFDPNEVGKRILTINNPKDFNRFKKKNIMKITDESGSIVYHEFKNMRLGNIIRIKSDEYSYYDNEEFEGDFVITEFFEDGTFYIFPVADLTDKPMNKTHTTDGGFIHSLMNRVTLKDIKEKISNIIGKNNIKANLTLASEYEIFGNRKYSIKLDLDEEEKQLALFKFIKITNDIFIRSYFWLRGVADSTYFTDASHNGSAGYNSAGTSVGVRPLILLG